MSTTKIFKHYWHWGYSEEEEKEQILSGLFFFIIFFSGKKFCIAFDLDTIYLFFKLIYVVFLMEITCLLHPM